MKEIHYYASPEFTEFESEQPGFKPDFGLTNGMIRHVISNHSKGILPFTIEVSPDSLLVLNEELPKDNIGMFKVVVVGEHSSEPEDVIKFHFEDKLVSLHFARMRPYFADFNIPMLT